MNVWPRAGEQPFYAASPSLPIADDYALVCLLPGLNPGKRILVLAGITTFGTQGAVEYVCEPGAVAELASRVGRPASFEAVFHVRVSGGVPVRSEIVALRE